MYLNVNVLASNLWKWSELHEIKKCSAACLGRCGMGQGGSPKPLSGATLASHTDCAAPYNVHSGVEKSTVHSGENPCLSHRLWTVEKRNTSHIVHSERHCGESNKHLSHQEQLLPNSAINGHAVRLNCTLPHEINLPLILCKLNSVKLPTCETHPIY